MLKQIKQHNIILIFAALLAVAAIAVVFAMPEERVWAEPVGCGGDSSTTNLTVAKQTVDNKAGTFPFTIKAWKEGGGTITYQKIAEISFSEDEYILEASISTNGDLPIEIPGVDFGEGYRFYLNEVTDEEVGDFELFNFAANLSDGQTLNLTIDGESYPVRIYSEGNDGTYDIYGLYVDENTRDSLGDYYYPGPGKTGVADTLYWNFGSGVAVTSEPDAYTFYLSQGGSQDGSKSFYIPEGYQYEVIEGNTTGWELDSVTSTGGTASKPDSKVSGTMSASGAHKATFTNKSTTSDPDPDPDPGTLTVTKKTEGGKPGTFSFKIKASKEVEHTYKPVAAFWSDRNGGLVVDTIDYDGLTTIFGLETTRLQGGGGRVTNKYWFSGPLLDQMDNILGIANSYYTGGESGTFTADFVKVGSVTIDGSDHDLFVKLQDLTTAAGGIYETPVGWSDSANKLVWRYNLELCDFYFSLYIIDDDNQIDHSNYNEANATSLPNPVTITTSEYLELTDTATFTPVDGEPGAYTFTLSNGASIDIPIPDGYEYTVEEIDIPADWELKSVEATGDGTSASGSTASGTMVENGAHTATFTNKKKAKGGITVTKTVAGNAADLNKEFDFKVYLADANGNGIADRLSLTKTDAGGTPTTSTYTTDGNGYVAFKLKHGESMTIEDVSGGNVFTDELYYRVVEVKADGYETSMNGTSAPDITLDNGSGNYVGMQNEGTLAVGGSATVAFTNTKNIPIPTGIFHDTKPWELALGISLALAGFAAAALLIRRRMRWERGL